MNPNPGKPTLPILLLDDDLVVVNKPSGLLVHRSDWGREKVVAMTVLRDQLGRHVFPVHRLDRATSGALAFALSSESASQLHALFDEGRVEKRYLALVRGVTPEQGVIDSPVPNKEDGPRVEAVTHYRRLFAFERFSLVEAIPKTGRLHQIRRHLKHISHPLVGDVNYGKGEINRLFRTRFGLNRLALHARSIAFEHPRTKERLTLLAALPEDLLVPFAAMGIPESAWE